MRFFLIVYDALWLLLVLPLTAYILYRSRRDHDYRQDLFQRFGLYPQHFRNCVWIHAVSLGETRSAEPLVRALLQRDHRVLLTHFTPAGKREAGKRFAQEMAEGKVLSVWVPFDTSWAYRGFLRSFRPRLGLVMEVEIWPRMIFACKARGMPLFMCNAQYASRPIERDSKWPRLRQKMMRGFTGAFVKSRLQAERFAAVGVKNIHITGELRFEQPIPPEQLVRAAAVRPALCGTRPVIALASVVAKEEDLFIEAIGTALARADGPRPFFIFVPRAPERFAPIAARLDKAGLQSVTRSGILDGALTLASTPPQADILLGDSLGEMAFYLALCDAAVVGGGFNPRGSHNIIEPLALGKPVIVGPEIWTIEYPAVEAIEAGVAQQVTADTLTAALCNPARPDPAAIARFLTEHAGAVSKTLAALDRFAALSGTGRK